MHQFYSITDVTQQFNTLSLDIKYYQKPFPVFQPTKELVDLFYGLHKSKIVFFHTDQSPFLAHNF